jgi:CHAD domain-containing protein
MNNPTLSALIATRLTELAGMLPGVRTADVESVHDARVLTRRLRELLQLAREESRVTGEAADRVRTAGRLLGEVREQDVLEGLLQQLRARARFASATLDALHHDVQGAQQAARRRMFKGLERVDLPALASDRTLHRGLWNVTGNVAHFRAHIQTRSQIARRALARASGVYLPKRSHQARIAIKKLRYAVETAAEVAVWSPHGNALKDLRRAQRILGDLHDQQVLADRIEAFAVRNERLEQETGWLLDLVRADIEARHRTFLDRVRALESAIAICEHWGTRVRWEGRLARAIRLVGGAVILVPPVLRVVGVARRRPDSSSETSSPRARVHSGAHQA